MEGVIYCKTIHPLFMRVVLLILVDEEEEMNKMRSGQKFDDDMYVLERSCDG